MVEFAYYGDDRWEKFLNPAGNQQSPNDEYDALTRKLVVLTGHEHIYKDGRLIERKQREKNYREALKLLNHDLHLGMDEKDTEILTLVYTALSEVPRYGGDTHIDPIKGENTGTHSIHTPLRANKIIRKALEKLGAEESRESVVMRQLTGLCLAPHDIGETLGEPGSLAHETEEAHKHFTKDKPAAEKLVLNATLRWATHAVEHNNKALFYDQIDKVKIPDMHNQAAINSNEKFLEMIRDRLGVPPEISLEGEGRVAVFSDSWEMIEHHNFVPNRFQGDKQLNGEFISLLASLCEHVQGTGHFNKFSNKGPEPQGNVQPTTRAQSARVMKNMNYVEGEVGALFAAAKTDLEKTVAIEAKKEVYTKVIDFLSNTTPVINRRATNLQESKPGDPGRDGEIAKLVEKFKAEERAYAGSGQEEFIRPIESRERLIEMYRWARDNDAFIPEPRQVLLVDPPDQFKDPKSRVAHFTQPELGLKTR